MTVPTPPQHPCPHGCGALLSVSTRTQPGETARCPECRKYHTVGSGELLALDDLSAILRHGTRSAMAPAQVSASAARHSQSSLNLDTQDRP